MEEANSPGSPDYVEPRQMSYEMDPPGTTFFITDMEGNKHPVTVPYPEGEEPTEKQDGETGVSAEDNVCTTSSSHATIDTIDFLNDNASSRSVTRAAQSPRPAMPMRDLSPGDIAFSDFLDQYYEDFMPKETVPTPDPSCRWEQYKKEREAKRVLDGLGPMPCRVQAYEKYKKEREASWVLDAQSREKSSEKESTDEENLALGGEREKHTEKEQRKDGLGVVRVPRIESLGLEKTPRSDGLGKERTPRNNRLVVERTPRNAGLVVERTPRDNGFGLERTPSYKPRLASGCAESKRVNDAQSSDLPRGGNNGVRSGNPRTACASEDRVSSFIYNEPSKLTPRQWNRVANEGAAERKFKEKPCKKKLGPRLSSGIFCSPGYNSNPPSGSNTPLMYSPDVSPRIMSSPENKPSIRQRLSGGMIPPVLSQRNQLRASLPTQLSSHVKGTTRAQPRTSLGKASPPLYKGPNRISSSPGMGSEEQGTPDQSPRKMLRLYSQGEFSQGTASSSSLLTWPLDIAPPTARSALWKGQPGFFSLFGSIMGAPCLDTGLPKRSNTIGATCRSLARSESNISLQTMKAAEGRPKFLRTRQKSTTMQETIDRKKIFSPMSKIMDLGFSEGTAKEALREANGNVEYAIQLACSWSRPMWAWERAPDCFVPFDKDTDKNLREAYVANMSEHLYVIDGTWYELNFDTFLQRNMDTGTIRRIRPPHEAP